MGEKGNLADMAEEIFANLAEQGPQFWIAFRQYEESRSRVTQAQAVPGQGAQDVPIPAQEQATQRPRPPAAG